MDYNITFKDTIQHADYNKISRAQKKLNMT